MGDCVRVILGGIYWDDGKENGNYRNYRGYIGVVLGFYWEYIGIMEKKMESIGIIGVILRLYRGYIGNILG